MDVTHSQGRQKLVLTQQHVTHEPPSMVDSGTNIIQSLSLAVNTSLNIRIKETIFFWGGWVVPTYFRQRHHKPLPLPRFLMALDSTPGF